MLLLVDAITHRFSGEPAQPGDAREPTLFVCSSISLVFRKNVSYGHLKRSSQVIACSIPIKDIYLDYIILYRNFNWQKHFLHPPNSVGPCAFCAIFNFLARFIVELFLCEDLCLEVSRSVVNTGISVDGAAAYS